MSLPAIAIRNPVFAWMIMAALMLFGTIALFGGQWMGMEDLKGLPVGQYPDVDSPQLTVTATLEGASPEIIESDVVDVIEDAVMAVEGIREITSTSKQGEAQISIEFNIEKDIDVALQDVQARISQAAKKLPVDMDPVQIRKINPEEDPIMWVALSGTRSQQEISEYAKNILRDRFLTVEGNGDVQMGGYLERNMRIWLNAGDMEANGVTADDVLKAIQTEHVDAPAGRMEGGMVEANVRVEGEALSVEEMRNIVIANRGGSPLYLKQVAMVENGFEDRRRIARVNGVPTQGLGIIKQRGANTVEVADAVKKRVEELHDTLPDGMDLSIRIDNSKFVREAVHEIQMTLVLAVLLTAIVCWFFLGSFSPTFNVILAIPVSIFGTFAVMHFAGFSLNTFTLLALSLSIGIVVDDAVMVMENIYRHGEMGKDKVTAAREGAEQITFAAMAATMAVIAIFLPVAFMTGVIGKYFFQFGVVLSVAVAISLLEALTLAPSRCAQFLSVGHRANIIERFAGFLFDTLSRMYRWTLRSILAFRLRYFPAGSLLVLAGAGALFAFTLPIAFGIPREMIPAQDQGFYQIRVQTPVGTTIDYTDEVLRKLEKLVEQRDEIEGSFVIAGTGDVTSGLIFVTLKDRNERSITQQQSIAAIRKMLVEDPVPAGVNVTVNDPSQRVPGEAGRGPRGPSLGFSIRGADWEELGRLSAQLEQDMKGSGVLTDINSSYRVGMPEVQVIPNREKTLAHNVDIKSLSTTVSALVGGTRVARYKQDGRRNDVRLRLLKDERTRKEDIANLWVRNKDGQLVRLGDVADVIVKPSLQSITRQNRQRAVTLGGNAAPGYTQGQAIEKILELTKNLPAGYDMVLQGGAKSSIEAAYSLVFALVLGVIVAYMILASQFNSFLHPFTVLLALPFSLTGAALALAFTGNTWNLFSFIGLILLMGIVKKNSILLVDYTNQMREEGKARDEALIEACPVRLRPVLMTTVATVAGAVPGALAIFGGGETMIPMSTAIIGGLTLSTVLTLVVVPCFYSLVDEVKEGIYKVLFGTPVKAPKPGDSAVVPATTDAEAPKSEPESAPETSKEKEKPKEKAPLLDVSAGGQ